MPHHAILVKLRCLIKTIDWVVLTGHMFLKIYVDVFFSFMNFCGSVVSSRLIPQAGQPETVDQFLWWDILRDDRLVPQAGYPQR